VTKKAKTTMKAIRPISRNRTKVWTSPRWGASIARVSVTIHKPLFIGD